VTTSKENFPPNKINPEIFAAIKKKKNIAKF